MGNWWVHELWQAGLVIQLVSWIFWILFSITLHELAHGWAALWEGDDTPVRRGRMTLNPVVHMGPASLLMFALCGIAWGQMPVNPSRFRHGHRGDVLVSAAGPAMNLALSLVSLLLLVAWMKLCPRDVEAYRLGSTFLYYGVALNIILATLNLLPIPPLDGAHILAGMSREVRELFARPNAQFVGMGIFLLVFFMTPLGDVFFGWTWGAADRVVDGSGSLVGNPPIGWVMYEEQLKQTMILDPELREALDDASLRDWLREQSGEDPASPPAPPAPPADPPASP
ncbi:MAG: site-2 protease family protein [Planctomycetota bacterium]|jgi:Zn-dependent protease